MDFVGADGTYDWIDEISHIQSIDCATYGIATATGGDTLSVYWTYNYEQAISESILVAVAYHNLENREDFLALRDGGNVLKLAQQDLLGMIGKLEASVDFIKNVRTGETEQNVLKLADLTGLESNLGDPEGPNFARDFETIDDALTWIHGFMSGPVEFTENLGPYGTPFTWTMDMSAMFDDPVEDWNDLLPYHRWNLPTGPWVAEELSDAWEYENYGNYPLDYYVYIEGACQSHTFYDIGYVKEYWYFYYSNITNPIELLDGPNGDVIDLEVEKVPYFPDYTLNGLFPGMSRSRWLELVDILGE
jgi:hypothetical protein